MAEVYTPEEAAKRLRVHVNTVYSLLRSGRLPAAKLGRGWRISSDSLSRYLQGHLVSRESEDDEAWLDSDLSHLGEFEPYGPSSEKLQTLPVRYVPGQGVVVVGKKRVGWRDTLQLYSPRRIKSSEML